jgi:hypothetical protein
MFTSPPASRGYETDLSPLHTKLAARSSVTAMTAQFFSPACQLFPGNRPNPKMLWLAGTVQVEADRPPASLCH